MQPNVLRIDSIYKRYCLLRVLRDFTVLETFQQTGGLDEKAIQASLAHVKRLLPDIDTEQSLPIVEGYRLLNVLAELSRGDAQSIAEAWRLLSYPFTTSHLGDIAEQARRQLLFTSNVFENSALEVQQARYQLFLFHARGHLADPSMTDMVNAVIVGAQTRQPATFAQMSDVRQYTGADQLLAYKEVCMIARLTSLHFPHGSDKAKLSDVLLKQLSYHPLTCQYLWQFRAFLAVLKQLYPGKTTFRVWENYLLNPKAPGTATKDDHILPQLLTVPKLEDQQLPHTDVLLEQYQAAMSQAPPFDFNAALARIEQIVTSAITAAAVATTLTSPPTTHLAPVTKIDSSSSKDKYINAAKISDDASETARRRKVLQEQESNGKSTSYNEQRIFKSSDEKPDVAVTTQTSAPSHRK